MKRSTTRTFNKKLQRMEERLLGPPEYPTDIAIIDMYAYESTPKRILLLRIYPSSGKSEWLAGPNHHKKPINDTPRLDSGLDNMNGPELTNWYD